MTIPEAAARWGISQVTVLRACADGRIPAEKVPHFTTFRWRVADDAVWTPRAKAIGCCIPTPPSEETLDKCMQAIHDVWAGIKTSQWDRLHERISLRGRKTTNRKGAA